MDTKMLNPGDSLWMPGLIYKRDHVEPLDKETYDALMLWPLPTGWSIVRPPTPLIIGEDHGATQLFGRITVVT